MAEETIIGMDKFFSPSRELCIDWIRSNDIAHKENEEKSLANPDETIELSDEAGTQILNMYAQEMFQKNFDDLSEEGKKEFEYQTQRQRFDDLKEEDQNISINGAEEWIRVNFYHCIGRLTTKEEIEEVSKDVIVERVTHYIMNDDKPLAKKAVDELFTWIENQPQPIKTFWGSITFKAGNIVMAYDEQEPLDITPHEVFFIEDKFPQQNSE